MFKYAAARGGALPTTGWTSAPTPARSPTRTAPPPARRWQPPRTSSPPPNGHYPSSSIAKGPPRQKNAALPGVHARIDAAMAAAEGAKTALRPIPAKVRATDLDPRRATGPPPPGAPWPANGAAAARVQRRSMAGRTLQLLPVRPQRIPGDPTQPAP